MVIHNGWMMTGVSVSLWLKKPPWNEIHMDIYIYIYIYVDGYSLKVRVCNMEKSALWKSVMVNHQSAGHVDPFCISTVGFRPLKLWETRKLSMAIYLEKYIPESNVLTVDHLKQTTYIILHLMFNLCSNNNGKTGENKAVRSGKIHKCCLSKTRSIGYHLVI